MSMGHAWKQVVLNLVVEAAIADTVRGVVMKILPRDRILE